VTADGGSTPPYSPSGGQFVPSPGPPSPPQPGFTSAGARSRSAGIAIALATVAVVLAAAALIVSVVRGGDSSAPASPPAQPSKSPTAASDTTAADKALCEAIAPLMAESTDIGKKFVSLGYSGTPERDNGIPQFRAAIEDWAKRVEPIVDADPGPPRFLTRTLQRYIDDTRLYAASIRPGPETDYDRAAWADRVVAYGGAFAECPKVGVHWW
jgi:hypothetical protein